MQAATVRSLNPNDKVLVPMPTSGNRLLSTWYVVLKRLENNNYEILTGNRKSTLHINVLRKFVEANTADGAAAPTTMMIVHEEPIEGEDELPAAFPASDSGNTASEVTIGSQLSADQQRAMKQLLEGYKDIFTSELGRTHLIEHSIRITDDIPCYQPPYRIPESMRDAVDEERNKVIKYDNETKYNSPLVIVKKRDGWDQAC